LKCAPNDIFLPVRQRKSQVAAFRPYRLGVVALQRCRHNVTRGSPRTYLMVGCQRLDKGDRLIADLPRFASAPDNPKDVCGKLDAARPSRSDAACVAMSSSESSDITRTK
jgi:hypothetical protein